MRNLGQAALQGLVTLLSLSPTAIFDGVVRPAGDGRFDAYLPPPFHTNHASFIEKLPGGDLVMAWFSGTAEGQNDVSIVFSRLLNDTWTNASVVSRRDGYSNQNPVLFYDSVGEGLHLFHASQPANKGEANATVWHAVAADGKGVQWSAPKEVFSKAGSFTKNRMILRLDGTWLLPIYYANPPINYLQVPYLKVLAAGEDPEKAAWGGVPFEDGGSLVQPSVVRLYPGKPVLVSFFRDRGAAHIWWALSWDDGQTWNRCAETSLPNNNAGIHATMLHSGRLAMIYNPQTHSRDPLAISLSEDGGLTWPITRIVEQGDGHQEFSYPTMTQTQDGAIHISYTYKREAIKYSRISEEWIMSGQGFAAE